MDEHLHKVDIFSTDLYQFTCSYSYFLAGTHEDTATFQVFFRKHPFKGEYAICAGISEAKHFLSNLQITEQQIKYLKTIHSHMKEEYFEWLRQNLGKTKIKVKSLKQGEIMFAKQPMITYTGPLAIVQLFETPLLNLLGFASLITTNASRMCKAAHPKNCIQFGIRRAQGPDGALSASHYAFLGGFQATSNVQASMKLGIPCQGTMSHAFITSFSGLDKIKPFQIKGVNIVEKAVQFRKEFKFNTHEGQLAAFLAYTHAFEQKLVALIDTYSTLDSGILNTIVIAKALALAGAKIVGIRLDSGDLCEYSKKCRKIWNEYVPEIKLNIVASDDLNQERISQMEKDGSEIDAYAIGTNIATCQKQPALGLVCKLVQLNEAPKMKFSQTPDKATFPAIKSVYRVWLKEDGPSSFDLMALEDQQIPDNTIVVDSNNQLKKYQVKIAKKKLLNEYWDSDIKKEKRESLKQAKEYLKKCKEQLPEETFGLSEAKKYSLMMTEKYMEILQSTLKKNVVLRRFR